MEYKVIKHHGKHAGMKIDVFVGNGFAIFLPTLHLMANVMRAYFGFSFGKVWIELGVDPLKVKYG